MQPDFNDKYCIQVLSRIYLLKVTELQWFDSMQGDYFQLRESADLRYIKGVSLQIEIDAAGIEGAKTSTFADDARHRINRLFRDRAFLESNDLVPSLRLAIRIRIMRECRTSFWYFLYRVELTLRERVTAMRGEQRPTVAETWRHTSTVGHVAVEGGNQLLEALVHREIMKQARAFKHDWLGHEPRVDEKGHDVQDATALSDP